MSLVVRHFCIALCVAILAAMNLHGVAEAQHAVGHAADWPAAALADTSQDHHDPHIHLAPSEAPDTEPDRDTDREPPLGHHHHGGADAHTALPASVKGLTEGPLAAAVQRRAGLDRVLSGLPGDGPEHPPKRMRTVT